MKCERCKSEWQSPGNIRSIICPFCHAPLIEVQEEFDDLGAALSYLVLELGTDILRSKQNTLQFLEVFFQEGKREYIFLNNLYASGLMDTLFRLRNAPVTIQNSAVRQVEKQLTEKYGVSKDWSEYVVGCVCKALGITINANEPIIGLRQLAERGNNSAQVSLAKRYQVGQGVERNQEQYIYWLKKAADSGYSEAQFLLGKELYYGCVCEKDLSLALMYLGQAAKSHNIDAMCLILSNTDLQTLNAINLEMLVQYLVKIKDELSSQQLVQLSKYFECIDLNQALELAQEAYSKDAKCAWQYYVDLLNKTGTYQSEATALKVTKDIAAEGNAVACMSLACRYEHHAKTKNDMQTALYWYRMAADAGELDAQLRLGDIYETGKLVTKDVESAIYWYKVAAYNGSQYAKSKVSYKSPECIVKTLTLISENDTELECRILGVVGFQGSDYLILEDPETKEHIPVRYKETDTVEGLEIEQIDEKTKKSVLSKFDHGIKR